MDFSNKKRRIIECTSRNTIPLIICLFLMGCGYNFKSGGQLEGLNVRSIAIPMFSSTSTFIGVEGDFTRVVREEFISHSTVRIVGIENADAVLKGKISYIKTDPLTYAITKQTLNGYSSINEVTNSRTLKISLDVELKDTRTGEVIWHDTALIGETNFKVDEEPLNTIYNQRKAVIFIAHELATKIYARTMERF